MNKTGKEISAKLVKTPVELTRLLEEHEPGMVCFSLYIWNTDLSLAFARLIKHSYPRCITVFGGPNYPTDYAGQQRLLQKHPEIDFFVYRDGEEAFAGLYDSLKECCFSTSALKESMLPVPGCHYYQNGVLIAGPQLPLLECLDSVPSPYLSGLCDEFLMQGHAAIIQTTRGCPFSCSYCQEGHEYFNQVRRYSTDRIKDELWAIGRQATAPKLFVADSNFGMYPADVEIAEELASVQKKHGWPSFVDCISGKNNKARVMKTASTIQGGQFSAAIQSSDPTVLLNINRQNVSFAEIIETATELDLLHTHSFSEIIVALPGDTFPAHLKSASDLIDAGIHVVRSHQLIMLPGAELATPESRKKYGIQTMFRIMHNTASAYSVFGQTFHAPEIDEICVANNTMSFQDYLDCRCFDLTVEIFYNNGVFLELHSFLKRQNISVSGFIKLLHTKIGDNPRLVKLYTDFLADTKELWESREALESFLQQPGVMAQYAAGVLGRNEQLAYKAMALFDHMDELIALSYSVAVEILKSSVRHEESDMHYLDELMRFDSLRKCNIMSLQDSKTALFYYDFYTLDKCGCNASPVDSFLPIAKEFRFSQSGEHRLYIEKMQNLLQQGCSGYSTILSTNPKISGYFKKIAVA